MVFGRVDVSQRMPGTVCAKQATFWLSRLRKEPGVRYGSSVLGAVVKALPRRTFAQLVERHDADRYDKEFDSWDHLMALLYGQLGGIGGLR